MHRRRKRCAGRNHCRTWPIFSRQSIRRRGANAYKVKGNIHWVSRVHAVAAEVRLYDRLFSIAQPDTAEGNFSGALNPESRRIVRAWLEPGAQAPATEEQVQFERQGYFVTDCIDSTPQRLVFNRIARLKDRWSKAKGIEYFGSCDVSSSPLPLEAGVTPWGCGPVPGGHSSACFDRAESWRWPTGF